MRHERTNERKVLGDLLGQWDVRLCLNQSHKLLLMHKSRRTDDVNTRHVCRVSVNGNDAVTHRKYLFLLMVYTNPNSLIAAICHNSEGEQ